MIEWISGNIATIIICAVLICAVTTAVVSIIRNKKKAKSSCGGGCSGCPMCGNCHTKK